MLPEQCDVVVIGSGPAGSMAAGMLASKGHDIVVIDKNRHPRYAVGESLIPDFWKYCDILGATERIQAEGFVVKAGGIVRWNDQTRSVAFKDYGYTRPALHVERSRFDQILFDQACTLGARAFENIAATQVSFLGPENVEVSYRAGEGAPSEKIRCRWVVDSTGQRSLIGSQLQLREIDSNFRYMSVWGYFENSDYFSPNGEIHSAGTVQSIAPVTYISSIRETDHLGWMWHIIQRNETSLGFVLPVDALKNLKGDLDWEGFYLEMCRRTPNLPRLLEKARLVPGSVRIIRDYSYRMHTLTGPGYFLTGDASGFIDPIYSNGVVIALYTGYLAAWALDVILHDPGKTEQYQKIFSTQAQHRMELARALALPNYRGEIHLNEGMQDIWEMARGNEKRLIAAAAALTGRESNFANL